MFFFFFFGLLFTVVAGIKLTLKQDLSKIQEELGPNEMGQFLHSIKNLPKLAEYLDPSRSPLNFDFYYYYNNYGCTDTRVFNWQRISKILTYGRLSKVDKLILLNENCLSGWPGFITMKSSDLEYFLTILPEINPILFLCDDKLRSSFLYEIIVGDKTRWDILIRQASLNRQLNFKPGIDLLFKDGIVKAEDFDSLPYYNLIGPNAIDSCYRNSRKLRDSRKCYNLISFNNEL